MSLKGMAESRRRRCHRRVWLKCSKPVARQSQVLPVRPCHHFKKIRKTIRQIQAPSPVFFIAAPGRPVFCFPPDKRDPPEYEGMARQVALPSSLSTRIPSRECGSASRRATRTGFHCPGSFAGRLRPFVMWTGTDFLRRAALSGRRRDRECPDRRSPRPLRRDCRHF